jgi:hypothetical protein
MSKCNLGLRKLGEKTPPLEEDRTTSEGEGKTMSA